ncbi:MAG TPA: sugar phosphate isomerase/epimerase family protein [Tepidisphaeraceae bacterium]|nr:sugar phosphate isomerase/epimerase family protein [Tepidisphaeraceae bacterium]
MSTTARTPLKLAAFADEISPQLDEQIRVCRECGVTHFELRGVYGKNVLDFDNGLRNEIKQKLADDGMGVVSIGSPIGKVKVNEPWEKHFDRFKVAVDAAEFFGAPFVRLFSYFPAEGESHADLLKKHRDEVVRRFQAKVEYVKDRNVTMVHENEKDIYGERGAQCVDLMKSIESPKLRSAFDFANFVQAQEHPQDNWPGLKPYSVHIHVKDAVLGSGKVVPAGQGDGQIAPILKDAYASGYRGWLSLEPHLAAHGPFSGFSGPELFKTAADALKKVCREIDVPLAGA